MAETNRTLNLQHEQTRYSDHYRGTAEDLVAAGLATLDQFPGQPGRGKSMTTYYRGQSIKKGVPNTPRDEHYLQIVRSGRMFRLIRGIDKAEETRRCEALETERSVTKRAALILQISDAALFKDRVADIVRKAVIEVSYHVDGVEDHPSGQSPHPFRLPDSAWMKVLGNLIAAVETIEASQVVSVRAQAARSDHQFQEFLRTQCLVEGNAE